MEQLNPELFYPSDQATDYFLDLNRGDAYGQNPESKKNDGRSFIQNVYDDIAGTRNEVQSLVDSGKLEFGMRNGEGDFFIDGQSVTKGPFGLAKSYNAADIFKEMRHRELKNTLKEKTGRTQVLGIGADGKLITGQADPESLYNRAKNLGLTKQGPFSSKLTGISNAVDLNQLRKSVKKGERKKDLIRVAGDEGISLEDLKTPEGKFKSTGKITKLIGEQVRQEGQSKERQADLFKTETEAIKTLKQEGYSDAQIKSLQQGKGLSPQATNGLNPQSGAQRVQQRAVSTGNPQVDSLINEHFSVNGGTPEALAKSLTSRNKIIEGVGEAMISNAVAFGSPQSVDERNWRNYTENTRKYENNQNRLNALQDAEAEYQFKREQQQSDHEMKQFEIRETNKMLREQYEKELEIEEQRRSEADFDNLTRMIMGMAGNL